MTFVMVLLTARFPPERMHAGLDCVHTGLWLWAAAVIIVQWPISRGSTGQQCAILHGGRAWLGCWICLRWAGEYYVCMHAMLCMQCHKHAGAAMVLCCWHKTWHGVACGGASLFHDGWMSSISSISLRSWKTRSSKLMDD